MSLLARLRRRLRPVSPAQAAVDAVDLLYRQRVIRGSELAEFRRRIDVLTWTESNATRRETPA